MCIYGDLGPATGRTTRGARRYRRSAGDSGLLARVSSWSHAALFCTFGYGVNFATTSYD